MIPEGESTMSRRHGGNWQGQLQEQEAERENRKSGQAVKPESPPPVTYFSKEALPSESSIPSQTHY